MASCVSGDTVASAGDKTSKASSIKGIVYFRSDHIFIEGSGWAWCGKELKTEENLGLLGQNERRAESTSLLLPH
jgi:hypothetical protein